MPPVRFACPPEPTDWCNVRFTIEVPGRTEPVFVWLGWDNEIALSAEDVGDEAAQTALRFVDAFRREAPLDAHTLLGRARDAYVGAGGNEFVGHIPTVQVVQDPIVEPKAIRWVFAIDGEVVTACLNADLSWECDSPRLRIWSTAKHAAIEYVLSNVSELEAAGFNTAALRRSH
jgi:hypothetical protein